MTVQRALLLLVLTSSTIACGLLSNSAAPTADVSTIVAATLQAINTPASPAVSASAAASPAPAGIRFESEGISLLIPIGLAGGASAERVPAVTDQGGAPWEVAPAYVRLTLQDYAVQGKFFQPQIMVYPAQEYAAVSNGASISIQRLQAVLASPSAPMTNDALPRLPFANAEQSIGALPRIISFQNGSGVRVLAQYAQGFNQINNYELFYHFEGFTSDGKSYIVATLPINAEFLAPGNDPASAAPPVGVPFPGLDNADPSVFANYYSAVVDKLNATAPDSFQPSLGALDSLIGSLQVSP